MARGPGRPGSRRTARRREPAIRRLGLRRASTRRRRAAASDQREASPPARDPLTHGVGCPGSPAAPRPRRRRRASACAPASRARGRASRDSASTELEPLVLQHHRHAGRALDARGRTPRPAASARSGVPSSRRGQPDDDGRQAVVLGRQPRDLGGTNCTVSGSDRGRSTTRHGVASVPDGVAQRQAETPRAVVDAQGPHGLSIKAPCAASAPRAGPVRAAPRARSRPRSPPSRPGIVRTNAARAPRARCVTRCSGCHATKNSK